MKIPVETSLNGPLPAYTWPSNDVEQMSEHLKIMRTNAHELTQKWCEKRIKRMNKRRQTVTFKLGDKAYKARKGTMRYRWSQNSPRFIGPFVILDKGSNDTYKLAHLHTGRILKGHSGAD